MGLQIFSNLQIHHFFTCHQLLHSNFTFNLKIKMCFKVCAINFTAAPILQFLKSTKYHKNVQVYKSLKFYTLKNITITDTKRQKYRF